MQVWRERVIGGVLAVGFLVLGVLPLLYLIVRFFFLPAKWFVTGGQEQSLLDATMGGLAATVFGIVIGIPVALWLSRRQQEATDAKEQIAKKGEADARQKKILLLIKDELQSNRDIIENRLVPRGGDVRERKVLIGYPMIDDLWRALSDGGELQYIQDVDILSLIAAAYNKISITKFLELKHTEAALTFSLEANAPTVQDAISATLTTLDQMHIIVIDFAIARINDKIK